MMHYFRAEIVSLAIIVCACAAVCDYDVGTAAPADALVLFDGTLESMNENWQMWPDSELRVQWKLMDDPVDEGKTMMSCCAGSYGEQDLITSRTFTDFEGHVEFVMMGDRGDSSPDGYCNSGVYLQNRHEIQIETPPTSVDPHTWDIGLHGIGAICKDVEPDTNVWRPQGQWNAFHFVFTAARWDGTTQTEDARVTVWWNGVKVHDNVSVSFAKGGVPVGPSPEGLKLQEHGTDVRFRAIWVRDLSHGSVGATHTVSPASHTSEPRAQAHLRVYRDANRAQVLVAVPPRGSTLDLRGRTITWKRHGTMPPLSQRKSP